MAKAKTTGQIKDELLDETPRRRPIPDDSWLSLGCTLLNMAVSGRPDGGIAKGQYLWFVGDSSSGKTWFALQLLAEAARNPQFDRHRFLYDNAENGMLMDTARFFGQKVYDRLEPPKGTVEKPQYSSTIEDFYYAVDDALLEDRPFIYVLDSMDALDAAADEAKFQAQKNATRDADAEDVKGSYGMAKAKANSQNIKRVISALPHAGSILVVLSQTRDKVGARFPTKTSAGGKAMKFYAHVELWTSIVGKLERTIEKKDREYGKLIEVRVRKNRVSGWEGEVTLPFLRNYGFDEIGSCVDYLVEEKHWQKSKQGGLISAPEFKANSRREDLVRKIQESGGEQKLVNITRWLWRKIDHATTVKRAPRYA